MRGLNLAVVVGLAALGCFDSRWGEVKRAQTNNAAHMMPATLEGEDQSTPPASAQSQRVRVYVTPAFTTQVLDHERQLGEMFDAASKVLAPALGIRLSVDSIVRWSDAGSEDDLHDVLASLHAKEHGDGADWVVACVGSIPKLSDSFHDVGIADTPGKMLVLRAPGTVSETRAIATNFDELDEDARIRLSEARKHHRAVSVLLHEVGHTLGAIHEVDAQSLMNPRYDAKMTGYSDDALSLMRVVLAHRAAPGGTDEARELLTLLEKPQQAPTWVDDERQATMTRLRTRLAPPKPRAPVASASAAPPPVVEPPELRESDREAFHRMVDLQTSGDVQGAWSAGGPLFKAYPKSYAIQDLRCQIAMKRVGWPGAEPECATLMSLAKH